MECILYIVCTVRPVYTKNSASGLSFCYNLKYRFYYVNACVSLSKMLSPCEKLSKLSNYGMNIMSNE